MVMLPVQLATAPAGAESRPAPEPRQNGVTMHMSYTGTAIGFNVMAVTALLTMSDADYSVGMSFRTVGLLSVFVRSEQRASVTGLWRGSRPEPLRFAATGTLRGAQRDTLIDYRGGAPVVLRLIPPVDGEREEVPPKARGGTVDTLSAIAFLIRHVADTGNCDGRTRVFDGRRLTEISARTVGQVMPARGETGSYEGDALRCDFAGQQLAGFLPDEQAWQRRPHTGSAWLGRVLPGAPAVPVRLTFESRWVGDITLVLTDAGPGPPPADPP